MCVCVCVSHHIKASTCTCICLCIRKHAQRSEADYVSDYVCMLRVTFAVSQPDLRIFLMDHKGGAAYRGRPHCLFIEKNKPCVPTDTLTECSGFHCWLERKNLPSLCSFFFLLFSQGPLTGLKSHICFICIKLLSFCTQLNLFTIMACFDPLQ